MTIKTLEYIHNLLIAEEQKAAADYNAARRLQREYEDRDAGERLIAQQDEAASEYMHRHLAAVDALEDFERQEW